MKSHTIEEINELKAWFETSHLPESLQLDQATFIPNLADTVDSLFIQAYIYYENPKMQGGIILLKKIKEALGNSKKI